MDQLGWVIFVSDGEGEESFVFSDSRGCCMFGFTSALMQASVWRTKERAYATLRFNQAANKRWWRSRIALVREAIYELEDKVVAYVD